MNCRSCAELSTILSLRNFGCLQFLTCQKLKPPPPFFLQANSMSTGSLPLPTHFACGILYLELNALPLLGACSQVIIRLIDNHGILLVSMHSCSAAYSFVLFSLPSHYSVCILFHWNFFFDLKQTLQQVSTQRKFVWWPSLLARS